MIQTTYTIHDYVPGVDVITHDAEIAEHWSRKERVVTAEASV
jgi:hypothetical protein